MHIPESYIEVREISGKSKKDAKRKAYDLSILFSSISPNSPLHDQINIYCK